MAVILRRPAFQVGGQVSAQLSAGNSIVLAPAAPVEVTYETSDLKPIGSGTSRSFNYALPEAKIIFCFRTVRGSGFSMTVGGNAATLILEDSSLDSCQIAFFEYDNTVTSSQTITINYAVEDGALESIMTVYSVQNATSVTSSQTLPASSSENEGLIFMSSVNNQSVAIPDQTNALTVDYNQDIRSGELHYSAHINGATTLSTNSSMTGEVRFASIILS